jgi:hypothetical protein
MEDYTFKFKDNGIVFNTDADPLNPFIDVELVQGLGQAEFRVTERDREGIDGGYVDAEYEKMRTIIIEGTVYATHETLEPYLEQLKANFAPNKTPQPFYWTAPGIIERVVFCKSYGFKYDWTTARRTGITPFQVQLMAEDPTIYGSLLEVSTAALASEATGRGYDRGYNYGYGPAILGGLVEVNNAGNKETGASITIFGPIIAPAIVHDVSGRQLNFDLILAEGETLTVDLRARTVMLNGTANRRTSMSGNWFMLQPGNNSIRLLGTDPIGGTPDPSMVVSMRSAYR